MLFLVRYCAGHSGGLARLLFGLGLVGPLLATMVAGKAPSPHGMPANVDMTATGSISPQSRCGMREDRACRARHATEQSDAVRLRRFLDAERISPRGN
jgi:hypothetical protein